MTNPDGLSFDIDAPEADVVEQLIPVDVGDDDAGLSISRMRISPYEDASEADLIDQAIAIPLSDDDPETAVD